MEHEDGNSVDFELKHQENGNLDPGDRYESSQFEVRYIQALEMTELTTSSRYNIESVGDDIPFQSLRSLQDTVL